MHQAHGTVTGWVVSSCPPLFPVLQLLVAMGKILWIVSALQGLCWQCEHFQLCVCNTSSHAGDHSTASGLCAASRVLVQKPLAFCGCLVSASVGSELL